MARFHARDWMHLMVAALTLVGLLGSASVVWAQADDDPFGGPPAGKAVELRAVDPTRPKPADDRRAEQKIREALQVATQMEFIETPLQDAVDYLKDHHGIEIQLDNKTLEECGVGSDTPVTRTLKGISLDSALTLMLSTLELTYVVDNGVLLITTPDAVAAMIELRVYDVHDLLLGGDVHELSEVLRLALVPPQPKVMGGVVPSVSTAAGRPHPETLVANHQTGQATPWPAMAAASGSVIMPYGKLIVVRASIVEHEAIAELLESMRTAMRQAGQ
ncbi:MAG: hypothetical protein WD845_07285 [Pirellulales bacterium]